MQLDDRRGHLDGRVIAIFAGPDFLTECPKLIEID
jgi:hypothetical protein